MFVGNYTGGRVRRIRNRKLHHPSYYFIYTSFVIIISGVVFSHNFIECDSAYVLKNVIDKQDRLLFYLQYEPTGCTVYFQFISIINFYMFRAGFAAHRQEVLLRIYSSWYMPYVYVGWLLAGSCQHKRMTYNFCIYRVVPPDDEE